MKKNFIIFCSILTASFGFLSVSHADFEISDGTARALYHFNLPNQTSDTVGLSDLTGGTFHGNFGNMVPNLHESTPGFGATAPNSSPSSNYTQVSTSTGLSFGGWFLATSTGAMQGVLLESHLQDFSVQIHSSSSVQCQMTDNAGSNSVTYSIAQSMPTSTPNLVVCAYHNGFMNLYVNNALVGGPTAWGGSSPAANHPNDYIAAGGDYTFDINGAFDELFVINKLLLAPDIAALWNGGNGNEICITIGCGSNVIPPTINFVWPKDGTSTPNFGSWAVQYNANSTTTHYYNIVVNYGQSSSSQAMQYTDSWPNISQPGFGVAGLLPINQLIRKHISFAQNEEWSAAAYLIENGSTVASTSVITFTIDGTKTIPAAAFTSSTLPSDITRANNFIQNILLGIIPAYNETIYPAGSTTTLAQTLCTDTASTTFVERYVMQTLFCPTDMARQFVQDQFSGFQDNFPFSIFKNINNSIQIASTASTTDKELSVTNSFYGTIVMASSSSLSQFIGTSGKNQIFALEDDLAWMVIAFAAVEVVYKHFHS